MNGTAVAEVGMVQRPSGLVVPFRLAHATEAQAAQDQAVIEPTLDEDGRRRVVFNADELRLINRVAKLVMRHGFGFVLVCREDPEAKTARCGQPLQPEDQGTPDHGYGCKCTRLHLGK